MQLGVDSRVIAQFVITDAGGEYARQATQGVTIQPHAQMRRK
jgi:hypothetical protein